MLRHRHFTANKRRSASNQITTAAAAKTNLFRAVLSCKAVQMCVSFEATFQYHPLCNQVLVLQIFWRWFSYYYTKVPFKEFGKRLFLHISNNKIHKTKLQSRCRSTKLMNLKPFNYFDRTTVLNWVRHFYYPGWFFSFSVQMHGAISLFPFMLLLLLIFESSFEFALKCVPVFCKSVIVGL